jgi:hypothetical protein
VRSNLADFPEDQVRGRGIEARRPDESLLDQLDLLPSRTLEVLIQQAPDLANPAPDRTGVLNSLERCGVSNFVEDVRRLAPEVL